MHKEFRCKFAEVLLDKYRWVEAQFIVYKWIGGVLLLLIILAKIGL